MRLALTASPGWSQNQAPRSWIGLGAFFFAKLTPTCLGLISHRPEGHRGRSPLLSERSREYATPALWFDSTALDPFHTGSDKTLRLKGVNP